MTKTSTGLQICLKVLAVLQKGGRPDHSVEVIYTVTRIEQYPKDAFPMDEVYSASDRSALRLITCGGDFDRTQHSYKDNIVVYAE